MSNLSKPNTNRIKTVLLIYKRKSSQIAEADRHILVLASHDKCCRRQLSLENTKHYQRATFLQMKYNRRTSLLVTFWRKKWRPIFHKKSLISLPTLLRTPDTLNFIFCRLLMTEWWTAIDDSDEDHDDQLYIVSMIPTLISTLLF